MVRSMTTSPPRRRPGHEAGAPLLAPVHPLDLPPLLERFCDDFGLGVGDVALTPLSSTLVPILPDGPRGTGVNVGSSWHPLLWLPPRLTTRIVTYDNDGNVTVEDDETWVVRVLLDVTLSGVYDDDGWVDMIAFAGFDLDVETDRQRVANWLAGAADDDLDGIDFHHLFGDIDDSANIAAETVEELRRHGRSLSAEALAGTIDDHAIAPVSEDLVRGIAAVAALALDDRTGWSEAMQVVASSGPGDLIAPDETLAAIRGDLNRFVDA
jgi:plasmid stabilization system protein ParE